VITITFLQKKLKETVHESIYKDILGIDNCNLEDFERLYNKTFSLFKPTLTNTLFDYIIARKKISQEIKIAFCRKILLHPEPSLREKAVMYLEALQQANCVPLILPLRDDKDTSVRTRVYWILAKHTIGDDTLTQQIIDEFNSTNLDSDQILLAAALYQRNNDPASYEMRFLKDYYLEHYYDLEDQELKVSLTGEHGHAAHIIGLILWEADIKLFAMESLEMHELTWLIEKEEKKLKL
jgi:hypothetical protein